MEAVIYARYSSDSQREESIEDQVRICKDYAQKRNINVVDVYTDHAFSATSDRRPGFLQMIADSKYNNWNYVICYKTDRFARSREDASKYKRILKDNGVHVIYAEMTIPDGPEGIILEGVMEAIDEWYSANLSQNIIRGMTGNAEKCKTNGVKIFGYNKSANDTYEINEDEAEAVRKVFRWVIDGTMTGKDIIDWLNKKGYRTTRGKPFGKNAIFRMVRNRKYLGEYKFGSIVVPGGMPAIIDQKTFNEAQKVKNIKKSRRGNGDSALLTGLLYCGECGDCMHSTSGTSKTKRVYHYYICNSKLKKSPCENLRFTQEDVDEIVFKTVTDFLFDSEKLEELLDALVKYQESHSNTADLERYKTQLVDAQKRQQNIIAAIEVGAFSDALLKRLNELNDEIDRLQSEVDKLDNSAQIIDKELMRKVILKYKSDLYETTESKRVVLRTFVNKILLYKDGTIEIMFNWTNNKNTPVTVRNSLEIHGTGVRHSTFGGAPGKGEELHIIGIREGIKISNDGVLCVVVKLNIKRKEK